MFKRDRGGSRSAGHKVSLLGKRPSDGKRQGQMSKGMQRMLGGKVGLLGKSPTNNMNTGLYQEYDQNYQEPYNYDSYTAEDNSGYVGDKNIDGMPLQYEISQPPSLLSQAIVRRQSLLEDDSRGRKVPVSRSEDRYYEEDYGNQGYGVDQGGQGYGVDQGGQGYGIDQGGQGYSVDQGDQGYGVDQGGQGYGVDHGYDVDHGYGVNQGYGVDQRSQGYGVDQSGQGYGVDQGGQGYGVDQGGWGADDDNYALDYGRGTQQHRRGGLLDAPSQKHRGGSLLDAPNQQSRRGGLLDSPVKQHRGGGLLDLPVQQHRGAGYQDASVQQHRGGGLLDDRVQLRFGYSDMMEGDRNSMVSRAESNMKSRNFGGRGQDMGRRQDSQQNQMSYGLQQRQMDLLKKADLQIRMIEQEKMEQERRQRDIMQQDMMGVEAGGMSREMQALLETQHRALMLQQREKSNKTPGEGLLGDRPGSQQNNQQHSIIQRMGPNIPSIFDFGGGQRRSLLGKRPSATQAKAAQVAKRARQEFQISRNKPVSKSRQSPPRQRRNKRDGSRRSRYDNIDSSKSHDRKDSAKGSIKSPSKQPNSSGSTSKDKDRSRRESKSEKETATVTVTAGGKHDPSKPSKDTKEKKNSNADVQIAVEEPPKTSGQEVPVKTEKKDTGWDVDGKEKDKTMDKSLTVTVSKKGRSVNDSDVKQEEIKTVKYRCNVCDVKCYDELSFSRHMKGMKHSRKMETLSSKTSQTTPLIAARKMAEEHLRQIETKEMTSQGKSSNQRKEPESSCKITGDNKDQKEEPKDQKRKQESWPECKICDQKFKSPQKFVLHCKTDHHIENKKKGDKEDGPDDLKDLVTLDTVGFEEENTATAIKEPVKVTREIKVEETKSFKAEETKPVPKKSIEQLEEEVLGDYNPDVAVGQRFVVPVSGFFCKLCHKFYNNESAAKGTHCQSQTHFEKYQKIVIAKMVNKRLTEEAMAKPAVKQEVKAVNSVEIALEDKTITQGKKQDNSEQEDESREKKGTNNTDKGDNIENGTDKNNHSRNSTNETEKMDTRETDDKEDHTEIRIDVYPESRDSIRKGSSPRARRGRGRGGFKK